MSKLPTIILLTLLLAGCQPSSVPLSQSDDLWVLESPGEFTNRCDSSALCSIEFLSDGKLRGYAPCNMFYGSYTTSGSKINIAVNGVTMSPCADDQAQTEYIKRLTSTSDFVITPNQELLLTDRDSGFTLSFVLSARMGNKK